MALFQKSVLNKYLEELDDKVVSDAYKRFKAFFFDEEIKKNIIESKEEQFQYGFLEALFVNVLGYTISPNSGYNLTTEFKNQKGAKKADGAILSDDKKALAVIELKSTKTKDLEAVRKQAFDYKANHESCIYVVTSNFEKLRFYINNSVDYEEFHLFNDPQFELFSTSYESFKLLYLCLSKDSIFDNVPLKIKEGSLLEEEAITKKFYADYSLFKRELYRDLVKKNMQNAVLKELAEKSIKKTLFKKSQKLLDRFLFIFFAEDRGLLPPNAISQVLSEWEKLRDLDEYTPLYERYKKHFDYLDKGYKGKVYEIFAYNGGLFEPDAILDSLLIDDDLLLRHTSKLTKYNFKTDVDVDILGHIFEHSLNEIESINAEIEGVQFDKQKTKRKKDGIFYTPKYITKYIVDNSIGKLCEEKRTEHGIVESQYVKGSKGRKKETIQELDKKLKAYRDWLMGITICDPACGSGAFLNQALDFLIKEHRYIDELESKVHGRPFVIANIEKHILENNIYGVDLNDESIEIAKLSLWLRTAQKGRKLTTLSSNIKCGNSLIDDRSVAGEKAFKWEDEFPEVFEKGGFDVVIGNPPWGAKFSKNELKLVKINHQDIIVRMVDSFMFFVDKSINLTSAKNGCFGLIIPDVILHQKDNEKLREKLLNQMSVDYALHVGDGIFEDVARPSAIIICSKSDINNEITYVGNFDKKFDTDIFSINYEPVTKKLLKQMPNGIFPTKEIQGYKLINRFSNVKLKQILDDDGIQRGVSPDLKKAFIVTDEEVAQNNLEKDKIKKTVTGGVDVKKYHIANISKNILYILKDDNPEHFPNIYNYILQYKNNITCVEIKEKKHPFYSLHRGRNEKIFNKKSKIIGVITGDKIITATDTEKLYPTDGTYLMSGKKDISNKAISTILNSKLATYLYRLLSTEANRTMAQVKPVILSDLPFVIPNVEAQKKLEMKYNLRSSNMVKLASNNSRFAKYLISSCLGSEENKKIINWHKMDFLDFIKELNKAIKNFGGVTLSKKDEIEWMELFEDYKEKANQLQTEIEKTDQEIDRMVYDLYGLKEDEIALVESAIN